MAENDLRFINKVVKVFDGLLEEDGWDNSFLLQVSKKRLIKARDSLRDSIAKKSELLDSSTEESLSSEQIKVYVSLYHSGGSSLFFWESMLKVLSSCSLGRPIYANEADVIKAISSRPDLKKEAYVELVIYQSDIIALPKDKQSVDVNNVGLLTVKPGAVDVSRVKRFVHANKDSYIWQKGKLLVKKA